MDVLQNYFEYRVSTLCGFPSITLEGQLEDWQKIRVNAETLISQRCKAEFAADWLPALLPLLDKFIEEYQKAQQGIPSDEVFWNSMCKRGSTGGSGGYTWFTGWFNIFFPYLKENEVNCYCVPYSTSLDYVREGRVPNSRSMVPDIRYFPDGLSTAPVKWMYFGKEILLEFKSGFICAKQDPETKTISANMAWYIVFKDEDSEKELKFMDSNRRRSY
jgi:hypothetical protein